MTDRDSEIRSSKSCRYENLDAAAAAWLRAVGEVCKVSTRMNYAAIYHHRIAPVLGSKDISLITREDFHLVIFENPILEGAKPSSDFARNTCRVLVRIIQFSEANINLQDILRGIALPSKKKKPLDTYTAEEQRKLFSYLSEDPDSSKLGVLFSMMTGCRLGEVCALKTEDICLESEQAYIHQTVQRIRVPEDSSVLAPDIRNTGIPDSDRSRKTMLIITDAKTETSNRYIPLQRRLLELLQEHMPSTAYLVNGSRVMDPRTYEYRFRKYQEKAGVQPRKFHVLRHTFATNCVAGGMSPKVLSDILGHSNVTITMNLYVHPTMDLKKKQINSAFQSIDIL